MEISQVQSPPGDREQRQINVGRRERKASMVGGAALALTGLRSLAKGSYLSGLIMLSAGGMFFYRGKTGHCNMYGALGLDTAGAAENGIVLERGVVIQRPPQEVYDFWHNLGNLPRFMNNLDSVLATGPGTSHWKGRGPGGVPVEWDAETVQEEPGRQISWRSIGESKVPNRGSVEFRELPGNLCEVMVTMEYFPPGVAAGKAAARFVNAVQGKQLEDDLLRLKQILETGAVGAGMPPPSYAASSPQPKGDRERV